jgi:crotonobetainyl-CoA:carnitine CoA-transferase CaiB-like acyl-CoA transferase
VHFARFQASGELPERHPSGSLAVVIFQAFDTADGQVIVAAANDRLFAKFAIEVNHPEWVQDARYKTNADRHANKDTLLPLVTEIMRGHASETWVARLEKAGVPCAAINDLAHMREHPQTAALGMVQPVPDIDLGLMSLPLSLDGERPAIRMRAPKLGEHNAAVEGLPKVKAERNLR